MIELKTKQGKIDTIKGLLTGTIKPEELQPTKTLTEIERDLICDLLHKDKKTCSLSMEEKQILTSLQNRFGPNFLNLGPSL